jgi:hypothetical protein
MTFADQDETATEEAQDETATEEAQDETATEEAQDETATEEAQDENATEEAQDETATEEAQDETATEEVQDEMPETGSEADEECDSDKAAEPVESCGDGCGCADPVDADVTTDATAGDFPVASLEMLLMTHHTQAVMALGMMPDPLTGETSANKNAAKFHIDMLSVIEEKTKGNLSSEEAESLSSILHQLRMAFFAS